jgi:hypothetical protein
MMVGTVIPSNIEFPNNLALKMSFKGTMEAFESSMGFGRSYGAGNLFAAIDWRENFRSNVSLKDFDLGSPTWRKEILILNVAIGYPF